MRRGWRLELIRRRSTWEGTRGLPQGREIPASALGWEFAESLGPEATLTLRVECGRAGVLSHAEALEELAHRAGQHGAALGLEYVLQEEFAARKMPSLVCLSVEEGGQARLVGAALLFEYVVWGVRTGLLATGDSFGVRTVFGAERLRGEIASASAKALLELGARVVLLSFKQQVEAGALLLRGRGVRWSVAEREVQDTMPIGMTLDETLAGLGKKTRTNLRAFRRRFDAEGVGTFVADAMGEIPLENDEFLAGLNGRSLDPIEQRTFNLQLRATGRLRGGFLCGLRSGEGQWLALVGGWRGGCTTWVEWQVNVRGLEKMSLGTVLRSYLLEEEVRRGTRRLGFHGSTSHSMGHSFLRERVVDLLGRRRSVTGSVLVRMIPWLAARSSRLAGRGNFLVDALSQAGLRWTRRER